MINPFTIMKTIEETYHLPPGTISAEESGRTKIEAEARAVAMYLVREHTRYSFVEIGSHFNKHHSTVMFNCKKIEKIVQKGCNPYVSKLISKVERQLKEI